MYEWSYKLKLQVFEVYLLINFMSQIPMKYRDEVSEVMDCIRHIFKALRVSSSQFEKELGLSVAQIFVLKKLRDEPGLSINDLAARTTTHQSSVSVVVKKLEEQGLVSRTVSTEDSRRVIVSLTEAGVQRLGTIPRTIQEEMIDTLEAMHPEKTSSLAKLMREFCQQAKIIESEPPPMFEER